MPVVLTVVDEDVIDRASIGLAQQLRASVADPEHDVVLARAVQLIDARESRRQECADGLIHTLASRGSHDDQRHRVSFNRAARRSGMPSLTISSTGASRMACTEPKCRSSVRLRAGPIPSTESSGDVKALRARTLR